MSEHADRQAIKTGTTAVAQPLHLNGNGSGEHGPPKPERRQHRLADGRRSRGFVALEVEAIDAEISCEALGLMARIRRLIDDRETDGFVKQSTLRGLGADLEIEDRLPALVGELTSVGLLKAVAGGFADVNFDAWCDRHERRELVREQWRKRKGLTS